MSYLYSYLDTSKKIIEIYNGKMPLSAFLKNFFSQEKKYGSRDRKIIAALCYNYFRIAKAMDNRSIEERLLASVFLFADKENELFAKEWNDNISFSIKEKAAIAGINTHKLFPFNNELSDGIEADSFNESLFIQPDLFIRLRPGKEKAVIKKLAEANITYKQISNHCFAFANGTRLENIININSEAVIQDASSQRVADMFQLLDLHSKPSVWDCCAASGGKSVMAYDYLQDISLTVSDIRQSIIYNLQKRFSEAGIKDYQSLVADVTNAGTLQRLMGGRRFDLVICDAPCSGSGTWGRTPEQLTFFKQEEINRYSSLQKSIATNAIDYVTNDGYFLYITCSVFKKENEEVVEFIQAHSSVELVKKELLTGYHYKADTMFAALFKKK